MNGIPDAFEYPWAAARPESGTPATISASTGYAFARASPAFILDSYIDIPSILLSRREK